MIPEKRIIRRIQSGGCAIHCQDCSISQLCIPFTLNEHELDQLDNIIERKKPIQKGQTLFKAGDELKSLYAIRSGTIKSYTITEQGDEQITGFHLAGDLVGFDAIGTALPSELCASAGNLNGLRNPVSKRWTIFPVKCQICASR